MSNDCFFKVTCSGDDDFTSAYQVCVKLHGCSRATCCSVLINIALVAVELRYFL